MILGKSKKIFNIKDYKNARDIALFVLLEICENSRKSNTILKETFEDAERMGVALSTADRAFTERTVIGTLDRMLTIDAVINHFVNKPLKSQKPLIRALLRMSVYQLLYMDRVPNSAVCNEAVKLAKLHGMDGLSGFVNGVLRSITREIESNGKKVSEFTSLSEKYSMPEWLCRYVEKEYGKEKTSEIFDAFLMERPETLRFNLSKAMDTAEDSLEKAEQKILALLEKDNLLLEKIDMEAILKDTGMDLPDGRLPVLYSLTEGGDITKTEAFRKGYVTVQDPASALVASFAAPSEKDFIIDVCSAPGGKTLALADYMNGKGRIEARDVSERKTFLIDENVKRCGFQNVNVRVLDALKEDEDSFYRADILIADLPCSGIGVIAKKPDIKLNLQPYTIEELQILQRDILFNVNRFVKPKGKLIYSTCTISKEENEDNVAWMESVLGLKAEKVCKLLPGKDHDGFFIAVMKKKY